MREQHRVDTELALASVFPAATLDDWLALAGDVSRLRSVSYDGITIEPLYTLADAVVEQPAPGAFPFVRGRVAPDRATGWDVRQVVSPAHGERLAVTELERGATSVMIPLRGVDSIDADLLDRTLDGVLLDLAPVVLDAGRRWPEAAAALEQLWTRRGVDPREIAGSLGADPFGEWASDRSGVDLEVELGELATWARRVHERYPRVRAVSIDGSRFHDAGASDALELGLTIASALATLRELVDGAAELDLADAFRQIELRLAATVDQFATVAKFRAVRLLWARVAEVAGAPEAAAASPIHACSSRAMITRYDPAVNMLRATVACFAAGVGGADAITVRAYDELADPNGTELGRRLARNTQSVLMMESHLANVIDPAGGSWYVERLTDELARAAWACLQEVEAASGFRAAIEAGLVDERIAEVYERRRDDIAHRRLAITGVSEFPNIAESVTAPTTAEPPPTDGSLARHRWAEDFESIRERVDIAAQASERPSIMIATLGTPAAFTARAMFAKSFFEAAGIDTVFGPVTSDVAEIAAAFRASPARVACICSNDATYAELASPLATALAEAGAGRVYLAGRPAELVDALAGAGVTHTIAAGDDAVAALTDLVDHVLEVTP